MVEVFWIWISSIYIIKLIFPPLRPWISPLPINILPPMENAKNGKGQIIISIKRTWVIQIRVNTVSKYTYIQGHTTFKQFSTRLKIDVMSIEIHSRGIKRGLFSCIIHAYVLSYLWWPKVCLYFNAIEIMYLLMDYKNNAFFVSCCSFIKMNCSWLGCLYLSIEWNELEWIVTICGTWCFRKNIYIYHTTTQAEKLLFEIEISDDLLFLFKPYSLAYGWYVGNKKGEEPLKISFLGQCVSFEMQGVNGVILLHLMRRSLQVRRNQP